MGKTPRILFNRLRPIFIEEYWTGFERPDNEADVYLANNLGRIPAVKSNELWQIKPDLGSPAKLIRLIRAMPTTGGSLLV